MCRLQVFQQFDNSLVIFDRLSIFLVLEDTGTVDSGAGS